MKSVHIKKLGKETIKTLKKTLIFSPAGPPLLTAGSILLSNLFRYFPEGSYCIFMRGWNSWDIRGAEVEKGNWLPCKYDFFDVPKLFWRSLLLSPTLYDIAGLLMVPFVVLKGIKLVRREKVEIIMTRLDTEAFWLSAYFIHRLTRTPFFVYVEDLFEENRLSSVRRLVAKGFEEPMLKKAARVFVISEHMRQHYARKYGLEASLLPTTVVLAATEGGDQCQQEEGRDRKIVFLGSIYWPQLSGLLDMVEAVNTLKGVKLYLYTPPKRAEGLRSHGLSGPNVMYGFARRNQLPAVLRDADILFLPLTFDSRAPDIIRTASPTKLPEYLAAGKPLIVYAPEDSYVSCYARERGFALVVDRPEVDELRRAILSLLQDRKLSNRLGRMARRTAEMNHDAKKISAVFQQYFQKETEP